MIGQHVRLRKEVENYPLIIVEAGETGIVTEMDDECLWVRLDTYHPELDEWSNALQVWNWEDEPVAELVEVITQEPAR